MPQIMKVSDAAYQRIKARAAEDGRTMIAALDRLLGLAGRNGTSPETHLPAAQDGPGSTTRKRPVGRHGAKVAQRHASPASPKRQLDEPDAFGGETAMEAKRSFARQFGTCPDCGCPKAAHREDNGRCDNHPSCRGQAFREK